MRGDFRTEVVSPVTGVVSLATEVVSPVTGVVSPVTEVVSRQLRKAGRG
jgi:hypothetical protein